MEATQAAAPQLELTDPRHRAVESPGPLDRFFLSLINDERDLPFVWLSAQIAVVLIPAAAIMYWPGVFRWWMAFPYLLVNALVFMDRYMLMLHNTSHRPLYKPRFRAFNKIIPFVLGPLFGQTPNTYFAHHLGMHHAEENLPEDLSSTMHFQRDRVWHFVRYWARFFFLVHAQLPAYLRQKGRRALALRCFLGEYSAWVYMGVLCWFAPGPTLTVLVAPFLMIRFLMMAGNWGQHAFIDPARPENRYVASITCINARYNRRCFNDGYHIGHHVKGNRHWTELPEDLERNLQRYADEGAIIFEGLDFFMVWLYLMLGRYDWLAKRYVELDGAGRSLQDIEALLRSRTVPILNWRASAA